MCETLTKKQLGNQARKHLPQLMQEHNHACFWCRSSVIMVRSIPGKQRVAIKGSLLHYRELDGTIASAMYATVDHVIPLEYGGDSAIDNLVPSCVGCNLRRSAKEPAARDGRTHKCATPDCNRRISIRRSKCKTCRKTDRMPTLHACSGCRRCLISTKRLLCKPCNRAKLSLLETPRDSQVPSLPPLVCVGGGDRLGRPALSAWVPPVVRLLRRLLSAA